MASESSKNEDNLNFYNRW